jgi:oxygen-independent coproporphyrinogen-3 oxidase
MVADLIRLFFPQFKLMPEKLGAGDSTKAVDLAESQNPGPKPASSVSRMTDETEEPATPKALLEIMEASGEGNAKPGQVSVRLQLNERQALAQAKLAKPGPGEDPVNLKRRLIRKLTLQVLEEVTGLKAGPWGILTGIRPSKVVHRRFDQGWKPAQIITELTEEYRLDSGKAELLVEVAKRQRPFLRTGMESPHLVSIYAGIPFCPSRCLYCSFPSYALTQKGNLAEPFLNALLQEIETVGIELRRAGIQVQSIYLGGGTPTALNSEQLRRLLAKLTGELPIYLRESWPQSRAGEFTVEAGRPDTLDHARLAVLREAGVNRLSINPQTMHDRTLRLIGRKHTAAETLTAFAAARDFGFNCLNMDIILGLPQETASEVAKTLEIIAQLQPDNLSVHTLAIKRASQLKEEREQWLLPEPAEVEAMYRLSQAAAAGMGLKAYYLYRQKNILGNLENVGYARPGWENVYNIQVMEERQTIIGLGGGAGSKWLNRHDLTLTNTYNPKDPQNYLERIEEIQTKKIDRIRGLR